MRTDLRLGMASILFSVLLAVNTACDLKRLRAVFLRDATVAEQTATSSHGSNPTTISADENGAEIEDSIPPASQDLLELATATTTRIVLKDADGSGMILGRDSEGFVYVLTVWHAAKDGIDRIDFFDVKTFPKPFAQLAYPELVSHSERLDLAVVRAKADTEIQFAKVLLMKSESARDPEFAYSSGCSSGEYPTVLTEKITGKNRFRVLPDGATSGPTRLMWVTDSPQQDGRSGGGLITVNGELMGLALGKQGASGYYCHFREIHNYLIDSNLEWLVRCDITGN